MKRLAFLGMMILGVLSSLSQTTVPNYGFENWNMSLRYAAPNNWYAKEVNAPLDETDIGYSRTTDKYAGTYALRLFNKITVNPNDVVRGITHTLSPNQLVNNKEKIQPAFPVFMKHQTLNGYYKFIPANGDSCQFIVWMYNHNYKNQQTQNTLGGGVADKGGSPTYIPFSLNISYYDGGITIPDSACISLSAFRMFDPTNGHQLQPLGNSELFIDNISFDGFITDINTIKSKLEKVVLSPNPASSVLKIEMLLRESTYKISLYDLNGSLVKAIANEKLSGRQNIDVNVEDLSSGAYLLLISTDEGYYSKKVVIN